MDIYNRYSDFLRRVYGEKVYKLPISLLVTCPNRENGAGGCTYCGGAGAGFENLSSAFSVKEQLLKNKAYIKKRYKAKKFIAYFQSFTNTYLPISDFEYYMRQCIQEDIVEIAISTRPDCIQKKYLDILKNIEKESGIRITIELGLQTTNYHTLLKINRGHTLAEYIESVLLIKSYGFWVCTHFILNLPWDTIEDGAECAKMASVLKTDFVKLHALYIEKDTKMAEQYTKGEFQICSVEEYKKRVILFLQLLSPDISVQRLLGRGPKENTLFANWSQSWWKIRDEIEREMAEKNIYQGMGFDYLGGKAMGRFLDSK